MPNLIMLFAAVWMSAILQAPEKQAKPKLPSKSGIYALTAGGSVLLTVSGESAPIPLTNGTRCFYAADDYDRIPTVVSLEGFYANMMDWKPKDLLLIVGREWLSSPSGRYLRLKGRATTHGVFAVRILAEDIQSPASLDQATSRVSPDAGAEVFVVLVMQSQSNLNDRFYPVRVQRPQSK
jgi:hypothetical protein